MSRARILVGLLALTLLGGCGAPSAVPAESPEPETVPPVYADWSKLTPYAPERKAEPLYSRFEPYQGDALTPREDYGVLLPYLGAVEFVSNYITDRLPLFGLVTTDGRVVTEPVYADIYPSSRYVENRSFVTPFLILKKGDPSGKTGNGMMSQAGDFLCTVAAPDGRWVRNFGIAGTEYAGEDRLAVIETDNSVTVLDQDGKTVAFFPGSAFMPYLDGAETSYFKNDGGPVLSYKDNVLYVEGLDTELEDWHTFCYLNLADGAVSANPPAGFSTEWPEGTGRTSDGHGHSPIADNVTGEVYYYRYDHAEGAAYPTLYVVDGEQRPLLSVEDDLYYDLLYQPLIWNGLCSAAQEGAFCYYDLKSGECVFRFPLRSNLG